MPTYHDIAALRAVCFARVSGSEAELRIVVGNVDAAGAGSGQVDDAAAAAGNDGGDAGHFIQFC